VPSFSMQEAEGKELTITEEALAACEEAAVLHVQRWLQWLKTYQESHPSSEPERPY
jgi:hypothetical protein